MCVCIEREKVGILGHIFGRCKRGWTIFKRENDVVVGGAGGSDSNSERMSP